MLNPSNAKNIRISVRGSKFTANWLRKQTANGRWHILDQDSMFWVMAGIFELSLVMATLGLY
jgi:hypothetical protein